MSKLGSAPIGVYSDNGAVLQGLQQPNGNLCYLVSHYDNLTELLNDYAAGLLSAGKYQTGYRTFTHDGVNLYAEDGRLLVRHVAANVRNNDIFDSTNKQMMGSTPLIARGAIQYVGCEFPNFWMSPSSPANGQEHGVGAATTLRASIEYPAGTFTQLTFGGSSFVVVPDSGCAQSDLVALNIPEGAVFFVRYFFQNSAGIIYNGQNQSPVAGGPATFTFAVSGLSDLTMGGVISDTGLGFGYSPYVVFGITDKPAPAVAMVGDSRIHGEYDVSRPFSIAATPEWLTGYDRVFGKFFASANYGIDGESIPTFIAGSTQTQRLIKKYFTHVVADYGTNDIFGINSSTLADVQGWCRQFCALWGNIPVFWLTVNPYTTSTDNFATATNQSTKTITNSVGTLKETIRQGFNTWLRTGTFKDANGTPGWGIPNLKGVFDIAAIMEVNSSNTLTLNGGLWLANGLASGSGAYCYYDAVSAGAAHESTQGLKYLASQSYQMPIHLIK